MRALLPCILLAALPLAGCLAQEDAPPSGRAARVGNATEVACEREVGMRWAQPALFGLLWDLAPPPSVATRRWSPPPLLAFDAPEVPESWRSGSLAAVWWRASEREVVTLEAQEDGTSYVSLHPVLSDARRAELVGAFLDALGLGSHPRHAEWVRGHAEGGPGAPRAFSIGDARPDLEALRARLAREGPPTVEAPGAGGVLKWGEWEFRFALAHVSVESADVRLMVDRAGTVSAFASVPPYAPAEEALRARVDALLARLGVPVAGSAGMEWLQGGGIRC